MDGAPELEQLARVKEGEARSNDKTHKTSIANKHNKKLHLRKLKDYKWCLRIATYILFLLVGQTTATLLVRLYFDKGGNSKWMATFAQSSGFPILLPLLFFFPKHTLTQPPLNLMTLPMVYLGLGLVLTGDNLMYSYGLRYLPVSTYALLCASQLAFNAVSSFFINSQRFTALVFNSLVLLTISACLLAVDAGDDGDGTSNVISRAKYTIGFLCTLGASAICALYLSLVQLSFQKVLKDETFNTVICMQFYPSFVATCACVVGLFASGDWRTLKEEMRDYKKGRVSYIMTLAWTAITWQVSSVGLLGLIFEVSSLFSNVICTLGSPLVPVFAVVFFHEKMNGVKVISLVLAVWGFLSYIYQHYLDDTKPSKENGNEVSSATTELC